MKQRKFNRMASIYSWNYVMILPGVVLLFLFAYLPMAGVLIAFKDYDIFTGVWASKWIGWDNFYFLSDPYFWETIKNTLYITVYRLIFGFPAPIVLALMLNELRSMKFKRTIQSISYLPHFISWIIVAYMLQVILALDTGVVNNLLQLFGAGQISFMGRPEYFRFIIVVSAIWKDIGWGTIIYLAALTNISQEQVESAMLDGAGRIARIWHINIPGIMPVITILLILYMPMLLSAGYDQIYPLVNPSNLEVSNVLDVYVIRLGLAQSQFSVATAIGLFSSVIQLALVLAVNYAIKKKGLEGLW
ncbi:MAG: sugar ABC transporter permease [Paenibacillaceae bacterium]|uniref:ABC transporter permease n=1 Tax=Paenibacillus cymbidii TaxID=1639034 RepID=UPI0010814E02|nr:ABC transporter permease subunit [Paenibacillus cymbidii]MBO9610666.1 sugar ABC transporter permease [Paenibacillaceae bacterium]